MRMLKLEYPYAVNMTVNKMYYSNPYKRGMKFLTQDAKALRAVIIADTQKQLKQLPAIHRGSKLRVSIVFVDKFLNNDLTIKKRDLDNRLKFLIDSVFIAIGLDDSQIWHITAHKRHDMEERRTLVGIADVDKYQTG